MTTVHCGIRVFFLNESLSLVFRHFDAGSEGEVPGCNLATYLGNRNGAITTRMMGGLEHPGRFGNPFTKKSSWPTWLKPFWLKGCGFQSWFAVWCIPPPSLPPSLPRASPKGTWLIFWDGGARG